MNLGEVLLGACLVVASILAFWIALPREGVVRPLLRNDAVQAYYAVSCSCTSAYASSTSSRAFGQGNEPSQAAQSQHSQGDA